jgi:hypothetical protein
MPTTDSIQAFRGASFKAMIAPRKGMNTGAPTFKPQRLAASKCPHSWIINRKTNPTAHQNPQNMA